MEETKLLQQFNMIRGGDMKAFAAVYEAYKRPVYTLLLQMLPPSAAEDVMQDVFLSILRMPPKAEIKNPKAWLYRVARNRAVDALRKRQSLPLSEELPAAGIPFEQDTADRLDLARAMETLSAEERALLSLRFTAMLTLRETAEVMELSLPTAFRRQHKALCTLREILNGGTE
ncbi:MAG: sigma-70 family RNA polymerase sigma factor [Clostridiales bacterium]|nr:sigma-70 family RNA polymerase sigma factor [Clostridiales bacterium]